MGGPLWSAESDILSALGPCVRTGETGRCSCGTACEYYFCFPLPFVPRCVGSWATRAASACRVQRRRGRGGGNGGTISPICVASAQGPRVEESSGSLGNCEKMFPDDERGMKGHCPPRFQISHEHVLGGFCWTLQRKFHLKARGCVTLAGWSSHRPHVSWASVTPGHPRWSKVFWCKLRAHPAQNGGGSWTVHCM